MKIVAIVSAVGGAGRTTLAAALASLLAARRHAALAVECDPRNVLALHFGLRESARDGLVSHLLGAADAWAQAALESDDGVLVVPWGAAADDDAAHADAADNSRVDGTSGTAAASAAADTPPVSRAAAASGPPDIDARLDARLHGEPHWLRDLLARIDLPSTGLALVDSAVWPSPHARQAIDAADLVLAVLPPDAAACATLPRLHAALQRSGKPCVYVANAVQPARALHTDIVALLRARLGAAMLPYRIHADAGIPEALAGGLNFCVAMPGSQAAHDLNGLASWLSHWASDASASQSGPQPASQPDSQPDSQSDPQPASQPDPQPDLQRDLQPDPQRDSQPAPQPADAGGSTDATAARAPGAAPAPGNRPGAAP